MNITGINGTVTLPNLPPVPTGSILDVGWAVYQSQQQKALLKSSVKAEVAQAQSAVQVAAYNAQAQQAIASTLNKSAPPAKAEINWYLLGGGVGALLLAITLLKR